MILRRRSLVIVFSTTLALGACARRGARDVPLQRQARAPAGAAATDGGGAAEAATLTLRSVATALPAGVPPRVLARASARAIATTKSHVYFGDAADDALLAVAKTGSPSLPVRIARRAPMPGALAISDGELVWIGNPGDVVLRAPASADASPTTIRDRGIFTDLAANGGDIFVVEQSGGGGALTRITGSTAARLATIDSVPRAVVVDAEHAYVVTPTKVFRAPTQRGAVATLAVGAAFGAAAMDPAAIYVTAKRGSTRGIIRVAKTGGPSVDVIEGGVRDAPIATFGGEVFFFDEARPALRARSLAGGPIRTLSEDAVFARPVAIAADEDGVYVATGEGASGVVVSVRAAR